jgi:hypothetical protein
MGRKNRIHARDAESTGGRGGRNKRISPNGGNQFGATDLTVGSDESKPFDESGGSDDAVSRVFGIRFWK